MNFVNSLNNSLISANINTKKILSKELLSPYYASSLQAKESLFYIQAYGQIMALSPFFYKISNLDSYQIIHTLKGEGILRLDNSNHKLSPNTVALIDCKRNYSISLENASSWSFSTFFINGNSLDYYYKNYTDDFRPVMDLSVSSKLPHIFEELCNQHASNKFKQELFVSKLITDLITHMILDKRCNENSNNNVPRYIIEIKDEFDSNYQNFYSLDLLQEKYNKSKYRISREFKHYIHKSPIQYLIECRINVSKKLLIETDYSITEISCLVGIYDPSHFINLFKKKEGITPLIYRKRHH